MGLRPAPFNSQLYRRRLQLTLYDGTGLDQKLHPIPVAANCTVVRSLVSSCLVKCNGSVPKFCSCVSTVKAYCTHFLESSLLHRPFRGKSHGPCRGSARLSAHSHESCPSLVLTSQSSPSRLTAVFSLNPPPTTNTDTGSAALRHGVLADNDTPHPLAHLPPHPSPRPQLPSSTTKLPRPVARGLRGQGTQRAPTSIRQARSLHRKKAGEARRLPRKRAAAQPRFRS